MTVAELIAALEKLPPDAKVHIDDEDADGSRPLEAVRGSVWAPVNKVFLS